MGEKGAAAVGRERKKEKTYVAVGRLHDCHQDAGSLREPSTQHGGGHPDQDQVQEVGHGGEGLWREKGREWGEESAGIGSGGPNTAARRARDACRRAPCCSPLFLPTHLFRLSHLRLIQGPRPVQGRHQGGKQGGRRGGQPPDGHRVEDRAQHADQGPRLGARLARVAPQDFIGQGGGGGGWGAVGGHGGNRVCVHKRERRCTPSLRRRQKGECASFSFRPGSDLLLFLFVS